MTVLNLNNGIIWESICKWCRKAGRAAARPVLLLWYVMRSKDTSSKDKWVIFGALAYLVLPIDILDARRIPVIGWLDEVTSLAVMVQKMSKYITPEIQRMVDAQLDKWFPEYTDYEMI